MLRLVPKQRPSKDKGLWDGNFSHLVNSELGRMHISQDFVTKLRANLNRDIENYRCQRLDELSDYAPAPLEEFGDAIQETSRIDEYTFCAEMVRAGHDDAVLLGNVLAILWRHQEKSLDISANVTQLDQKDRKLDVARYMESRANWFQIGENQVELKRNLDAPSAKAKKTAKKREKKAQKEKKPSDVDPAKP